MSNEIQYTYIESKTGYDMFDRNELLGPEEVAKRLNLTSQMASLVDQMERRIRELEADLIEEREALREAGVLMEEWCQDYESMAPGFWGGFAARMSAKAKKATEERDRAQNALDTLVEQGFRVAKKKERQDEKIRYVVHPGYVISADGDHHYIGPVELLRAYGLRTSCEFVVADVPGESVLGQSLKDTDKLRHVHLYPRSLGNYPDLSSRK